MPVDALYNDKFNEIKDLEKNWHMPPKPLVIGICRDEETTKANLTETLQQNEDRKSVV